MLSRSAVQPIIVRLLYQIRKLPSSNIYMLQLPVLFRGFTESLSNLRPQLSDSSLKIPQHLIRNYRTSQAGTAL